MGIDVWSLNFLMGLRDRPFGETLLLGRQGIHIPAELCEMARKVIAEHDPTVTLDQLGNGTGYAEGLFKRLGSSSVTSLDYTDYEGAEILHDLNLAVTDNLRDRFDTVFDGGTLEHVYNFPVAVENIRAMTKIGGRVIMITPANNWLGHGLYQFSPELLYRVFSSDSGFQVEKMELVEFGSYPAPRLMRDPQFAGHRIEILVTKAPTYLCVSARKLNGSVLGSIQQSDYTEIWRRHDK